MTPTEVAQEIWAKMRATENANGDYTRAHWYYTAAEHRDDFIEVVAAALADGVITAQEMHGLWKTHAEGKGWAYGETRNFNRKVSPAIMDFADIPTREKQVFDTALTETKTYESTLSKTELDAIKLLRPTKGAELKVT